jgi:hypothetical protein
MEARKNIVLSLYDFTGEAVRPWAEAGYTCFCFDIQHLPLASREEHFPSGGSINFVYADLHDPLVFALSAPMWRGLVAFGFGFPVCTDLSGAGARHWAKKAEANPSFQIEAAEHAKACARFFNKIGCPFLIENPKGALTRLWRKPDHSFNPSDFGGYLPEDDTHPRWPEYIPPRDAYTKHTCLWTGGGFEMPARAPVEPMKVTYTRKNGETVSGSPQWGKLGGNTAKTKDIRSATPRGFARAVFLANAQPAALREAA